MNLLIIGTLIGAFAMLLVVIFLINSWGRPIKREDKYKLKLLFPFLAFLTTAKAADYYPPAERLVNWVPGQTIGVPGGIPNRSTIYTNMVLATNGTDVSAEIQAALDNCPSNQVIGLPVGVLTLSNAVFTLRSGLTIRGAGMTNTTIKFYGTTGNPFALGTGWDWLWDSPATGNEITNGFTKGSSNLMFASTSGAWLGKLCRISESNDTTIPVIHVGGYEGMHRQLVRITAVSGNNITIWPPLSWTMSTNLGPKFAVASQDIRFTGVEDVTVDATNSISTSPLSFITQGYGCWFKNVKIRYCKNRGFGITDSLQCEIRGCFVDKTQGEAEPNHAGLQMEHSSGCLIEDNIFDDVFPNIEVNAGSCGNVFGYNFGNQTYWGVSFDGNHNPHNTFNLWEGNVTACFSSDGYYGSASEDTLFRNWFNEQIPLGTASGIWGVKLCRFTRNASVIGNILGSSTQTTSSYGHWELGQPNMGNESWSGFAPPWTEGWQELDTNVQATAIIKGNYAYSVSVTSPNWPTNDPNSSLGGDTIPNSLYQTAKPSWFGSCPWPAFNPGSVGSVSVRNIPAGLRYVTGVGGPFTGGS